jgi:hypothetical protein
VTDLYTKNAKYNKWLSEYRFDNCKLERSDYGDFITNTIISEKNGFVLNLNGSWGSGKTHFVKRLYTNFLEKKHPCIYIDAWESDFIDSPLTIITSELISQLNSLNSNIGSNTSALKESIGRVLKTTAIIGSGLLTKALIDDQATGIHAAKALLEKQELIKHVDFVNTAYQSQVSSIAKVREELTCLAEVLKTNYSSSLPVIVIIDELDRCRPNYAVEVLEAVKHFFQTKNFVFIISSDTEQLQHSIKTIYGSNFDSYRYLKRFFDQEAKLPLPDKENYAKNLINESLKIPDIGVFPIQPKDAIVEQLSILCSDFNLEIRDINQVLSKLKSCIRNIDTKKLKFDINLLLIAIIEHHKNSEEIKNRYNRLTPYKIPNLSSKNPSKLTANLIIEICFKVSSRIKKTVKDAHGNPRQIETQTILDSPLQIPSDTSTEIRSFIRCYRDACDNDKNIENLLKWDDYKKLISFAGTIS